MTRRLRHQRRVQGLSDCFDEPIEADAAFTLDVTHDAKISNLRKGRIGNGCPDESAKLLAGENPVFVPVVLIEDVAQAPALVFEHAVDLVEYGTRVPRARASNDANHRLGHGIKHPIQRVRILNQLSNAHRPFTRVVVSDVRAVITVDEVRRAVVRQRALKFPLFHARFGVQRFRAPVVFVGWVFLCHRGAFLVRAPQLVGPSGPERGACGGRRPRGSVNGWK